ncbi:MAG: hypothetical protein ACK47E_02425 [Cyclobacteriaceae bacterium]|jgi:hypothetical protein
MKTYILKIEESQEDLLNALVKTLQIDTEVFSENDEDVALSTAMEDGKKYGRLTEKETADFLDELGK